MNVIRRVTETKSDLLSEFEDGYRRWHKREFIHFQGIILSICFVFLLKGVYTKMKAIAPLGRKFFSFSQKRDWCPGKQARCHKNVSLVKKMAKKAIRCNHAVSIRLKNDFAKYAIISQWKYPGGIQSKHFIEIKAGISSFIILRWQLRG